MSKLDIIKTLSVKIKVSHSLEAVKQVGLEAHRILGIACERQSLCLSFCCLSFPEAQQYWFAVGLRVDGDFSSHWLVKGNSNPHNSSGCWKPTVSWAQHNLCKAEPTTRPSYKSHTWNHSKCVARTCRLWNCSSVIQSNGFFTWAILFSWACCMWPRESITTELKSGEIINSLSPGPIRPNDSSTYKRTITNCKNFYYLYF